MTKRARTSARLHARRALSSFDVGTLPSKRVAPPFGPDPTGDESRFDDDGGPVDASRVR
jgi:hypothetical protein